MRRYRFDFLRSGGDVFATHEIDYDSDEAAIAAGHAINGCPPIGSGFQVWRDGELIYRHCNAPPGGDEAPVRDFPKKY
jgi:hypothetical protein